MVVAVALALTGCASNAKDDAASPAPAPTEAASSPSAPSSAAPTSIATPAAAPMHDTMESWLTAVQSCMAAEGWEVTVDLPQNGIGANPPPSQMEVFRGALKACMQESGTSPNQIPVTPESAADYYDHMLVTKDCLEARGITASEPPSKATFMDDYLAGRAPWSPYADVPKDLTEAEWEDLNLECPQAPSPS